ncbi:MAG: 50S ribosomal protein L6 [Alphaproteobacteria bacterium]|jgi:large subunit ribosomal protein L6|nr:50S ribosomal protein L6 [Alphaproteobacteria bacterium]MBT5389692.1 50S ribosomal protein L6 [Alphaproteobacteria bacterium]MBT5654110.1 50S ribosomal protein L6 [Alphaproteobacteria bacterium]
MSRVGQTPVKVPEGVTVAVDGQLVTARGKLGEQSFEVSPVVSVRLEDGKIHVEPNDKTKQARMLWGTNRNIINNLIQGVETGFTVRLEINGVGYRAAVQGSDLVLQLGFSHEVKHAIPQDVTVKCEKPTLVSLHGINRQRVGQVAAQIRAYRPPEPYKGKGVKYEDERIVRKEGKKK